MWRLLVHLGGPTVASSALRRAAANAADAAVATPVRWRGCDRRCSRPFSSSSSSGGSSSGGAGASCHAAGASSSADTSSAAAPGRAYEVCRIDDNGGTYVICSAATAPEAARAVEEFEARGHKQVYFYQLATSGADAGQHGGGEDVQPPREPGRLRLGGKGG